MTQLNCTAQTCTHNKEQYCCKGDIMVGGESAQDPRNTCCSSFKERAENSFSNSVEQPSKTIDVDCQAEKCVFNKECKCSADSIGISGPNACQSKETECASFRCE